LRDLISLGKATRVFAFAAVFGIGASGAALAASCTNVSNDWLPAFNADTYYDCDGANTVNPAACAHLDLVDTTCCQGGSPNGQTSSCVETICSAAILVGPTGPLKATDTCNG